MRYITLSFDDGREDNYRVAAPILKKYGIPATIFCTTGFIDGSWKKKDGGWKSVSTAVTVDQLIEMSQNGWEIGLHGDKHITDVNDWTTAIKKLNSWGLLKDKVAFSVPDSRGTDKVISCIVKDDIGRRISCIRKGRAINTHNPWYVILFALYSKLGLQAAYNGFNYLSTNCVEQFDRNNVYSIVVKRGDSQEMLLKFIDVLPDNTWTVFMFHSILPENEDLFTADGWTYSNKSFEYFVRGLAEREKKATIECVNMEQMVEE